MSRERTDLTRVRTGSRLHFGLLGMPGQPTRRQDRAAARHFGGVGLMVEEPRTQVSVRPSSNWTADGPSSGRALEAAEKFAASAALESFHVVVESTPPEHTGLGSGTQLALATASAIAAAAGLDTDAIDMARRLGRGKRSAIGIHGFVHGGLLVDGGKHENTDVAPLIARADFPASWRIVLLTPVGRQGVHGPLEQHVFESPVRTSDERNTEAMCRLIVLGMLPAVFECDLRGFGETLYEFNRRAGEWFRPWQNGRLYAHPEAEAIASLLGGQGVAGVGQSSWGPTLFAVTESDRAVWVAERLRDALGSTAGKIMITQARNRGFHTEATQSGGAANVAVP